MPSRDDAPDQFDCLVIESWTASYPDPIDLAKDEPVTLDGRSDCWDGHIWLWAKNRAGKEGWIPDCLIAGTDPPRATEPYSALELTCQKGETLAANRVLHGWAFCSSRRGQSGWVPLRNIQRL